MAFVRAFGLHKGDQTPCGAAVTVSEAHALAAMARAGTEGLAQDELARQLALTKSTVSRLVDQLVERGWAERRADARDGRRRTVVLTDDGHATATAIAQRRSERMARLLERVPADQRGAVLAALDVLVEAADDDA